MITKPPIKQKAVEAIRGQTFNTCRKIANDVGRSLSLSGHFIDRFNLRSSSQIEACGAFQTACYAIKIRHSTLSGKKVFVQVGHHKFIFSLREPGQLTCVTFWQYGSQASDIDEKILIS